VFCIFGLNQFVFCHYKVIKHSFRKMLNIWW